MTDPNASPPPVNSGAPACPICGGALVPTPQGGGGNLGCRAHGVWLPADGLRRIVEGIQNRDLARTSRGLREDDYRFDNHPELVMLGASLRQTFGAMLGRAEPGSGRAGVHEGPPPAANASVVPEGQRPCPACRQTMASSPIEGVTADVCAAHGLWLDTGELAIVILHVEAEDAHRAQCIAERASASRVRALMNDRARASAAGGAIGAGVGILGGLLAVVGWAQDPG